MSTIKLAKNMWIEAGIKAGWMRKETMVFHRSASKQNCVPSSETFIKIAGIWDMWSKGKSKFDKNVTNLESYLMRIYKNLETLVSNLQRGGEELRNFLQNEVGMKFPIDVQGSISELTTMMSDIQNTIDYVKNNPNIRSQHSNLPPLSDNSFKYLMTHLENSPKIDEVTIDDVIKDLGVKFDLTDKQRQDLAEIKKHKVSKFFNPDSPTYYETRYKNVA